MKSTLLILVTGVAGRCGGIKQIDGFVSRGETIIDYSIYDAIKTGLIKISFIIRKEFIASLKTVVYTSLKSVDVACREGKAIVQKSISELAKNGTYLKQIAY